MQARSTIMLTGPSHVIILSSQRRVNGLDTPLPLAPPVPWETIASLGIFLTIGVLIYACIPHRKQHSSRGFLHKPSKRGNKRIYSSELANSGKINEMGLG
jgi:hypothetical protein